MKFLKSIILVVVCSSMFACPEVLDYLKWGKVFLEYDKEMITVTVINDDTKVPYKLQDEYSFMNGTNLRVDFTPKPGYKITDYYFKETKDDSGGVVPPEPGKGEYLLITVYETQTIVIIADKIQ